MRAMQGFYTGLPWKIYRNKRGWPRWWQRWYEAWLVVTGRYSFWQAYDQGKYAGSSCEYRRIVVNGGDLTPLLCAAVNELKPGDMTEQKGAELRAAIWSRYKQHYLTPKKSDAPAVSILGEPRGGSAS